jgi:hypothetical protein
MDDGLFDLCALSRLRLEGQVVSIGAQGHVQVSGFFRNPGQVVCGRRVRGDLERAVVGLDGSEIVTARFGAFGLAEPALGEGAPLAGALGDRLWAGRGPGVRSPAGQGHDHQTHPQRQMLEEAAATWA